MAKFSGTKRRPLRTNLTAPIAHHAASARAPTRAARRSRATPSRSCSCSPSTNMVGEDTFYERADERDARFVELVHEVTASNPAFIAGADVDAGKVGLAQYLRETMLMRSAAVVMAAEYVAAGGAGGRSVVARALQRADEPAELLGYWLTTHGRNVPMPVKRGIADAARRLYTERAALRYDGLSRQIRMADVIELTHPSPRDDRAVGAVQVPARPSSPRRRRRRRRRCCRCWRPRPRSTPSRSTSVVRCCAPAVRPRSPRPASRGSGCRAGCRAAWTPRRGRRSSRRWA